MFTKQNLGIWITGGGSVVWRLHELAGILCRFYRYGDRWGEVSQVVADLLGYPEHANWDAGIEWLDRACEDGIHFELRPNGDLVLVADESED